MLRDRWQQDGELAQWAQGAWVGPTARDTRADEHDGGPTVRQQLAADVDQPMATRGCDSWPFKHQARDFVFGGDVTDAARQVRRHTQSHAQAAAAVTWILEPRNPAKHVPPSLLLREHLAVTPGADLHQRQHVARAARRGRERVANADRRSSHLAHEDWHEDAGSRYEMRKQEATFRDHPEGPPFPARWTMSQEREPVAFVTL